MTRLLLLVCGVAVAGQDMASVKEEFRYSYPLQPGGRISVETFNGALEVYSWDRNEVEIQGTKYARNPETLREIRIETTNQPDAVSIRAFRPKTDGGWWRTGNAGVKMKIRVPRKVRLDPLLTSNGEIRVSEIEGPARATTSNGAIRITNLQGRLEATTSNGRIEASGLRDEAILRTSNGAIEAAFARFAAKLVEATTSNGPITLRLPGLVHADLRAATSNGKIWSDYDVTMTARASPEKNRLEGRIGEGGAAIRLTTSNGAIRIVRL